MRNLGRILMLSGAVVAVVIAAVIIIGYELLRAIFGG